MNQLVAPTNFITATSRRLAKIANWMVLKINRAAPSSTTMARPSTNVRARLVTRMTDLMMSPA